MSSIEATRHRMARGGGGGSGGRGGVIRALVVVRTAVLLLAFAALCEAPYEVMGVPRHKREAKRKKWKNQGIWGFVNMIK